MEKINKSDWEEMISRLEGLLYSPDDPKPHPEKINNQEPITVSDPNNIDVADVGEENTISAHQILKRAIEKLKEKIK